MGVRKPFKLILNDPTTPALIVDEYLPEKPRILDFRVEGFRDGNGLGSIDSLENQAANCYANLCTAISVLGKYAPRVNRWAMTNMLTIQPRAGVQFNAFYDRRSLRFCYATDPVTRKVVFAVNSREVFMHELGHAVLDCVRPDLYNAVALEVWAFHEAFGDIHATVQALSHPRVLDAVIDETGGDLKRSSILTKLAEEMGHAIYNVTKGRMGNSAAYMRDLWNTYTYSEPEKLPRAGLDHQLTAQSHSFSRVFSGAWYEMLVAIYLRIRDSGKTPRVALEEARDVLAGYTFGALGIAAANIRFYDSVAKAMLVQDKAAGYPYNDLMNEVFIRRGILREAYRPFGGFNLTMADALVTCNDEVLRADSVTAIRTKKTELLSLPGPLVNVEVPNDTFYEFDQDGECVNLVSYSGEELVDHANHCLDTLMEQHLVRPDKMSPWEITEDGRLSRTNFSCCSANINNSELPGAPEYGKPHKDHLHAGCCSGRSAEAEPVQPNVRRGCFVRHTGRNVVRVTAGSSRSIRVC